jgi:hypothetical protein
MSRWRLSIIRESCLTKVLVLFRLTGDVAGRFKAVQKAAEDVGWAG